MAKVVKPLSNTEIKNAKPKEKEYTLSDGDGLMLEVRTNGSKLWKFRYKSPITLKVRKAGLGIYPKVSLKDARDKKIEYISMLSDNRDPLIELDLLKKEYEKKLDEDKGLNFISLFDKFLEVKQSHKSISNRTIDDTYKILNNWLFPNLPYKNDTKLNDVSYDFLVKCLTSLEKLDKLETLKKLKGYIVSFYKYLFSENLLDDITIITKLENKIFKKRHKNQVKNHGAIIDGEGLKDLLYRVQNFSGHPIIKYAVLFSLYTVQRQGTILKAEWCEIDEENKLWRVPAHKMKSKKDFVIPLTDETMKLLDELKEYSGNSKYLFCGIHDTKKTIGADSVRVAFLKMGYETGEVTAHGLRTTFSTIANNNVLKHRISPEFIEKALNHSVGNDVRAVYNQAENLEELRAMFNWWSEYLLGDRSKICVK